MKNKTPEIRFVPRYAGAPKKQSTNVDLMLELLLAEILEAKSERRSLNVAIGMDVSSSMNDIIEQEPSQQTPGAWGLRPIQPQVRPSPFPSPWPNEIQFPNQTMTVSPPFGGQLGNGQIKQCRPDLFMPPHPLDAPPPGWEWHYMPGHATPGRIHTKMTRTKEAAVAAVDLLDEQDRVAIVSFSDAAKVVFHSAPATKANKEACKQAINQLSAYGNTALEAGWHQAATQVSLQLDLTKVNRVLILTDGKANIGARMAHQITPQVKVMVDHGITTSTFGVGKHYDEDMLQAMATAGDGRYYYLNGTTMKEQFIEEFSGMSQLYGRQAKLTIQCEEGSEIVSCLNDFKQEDGAYILPNLVRGHNQQIVLRALVNGDTKDGWTFNAKLSWIDLDGNPQDVDSSFLLPAISKKAFDALQEDMRVGERTEELLIAKAQRDAMAALDRGDRSGSMEMLRGATAMASGSMYAGVQGQASHLMNLNEMAVAGDMQNLRKTALYNSYELTSSRKTQP